MNVLVETATKITLAACVLHNLCTHSAASYVPQGFADEIGDNGDIIGEWRQHPFPESTTAAGGRAFLRPVSSLFLLPAAPPPPLPLAAAPPPPPPDCFACSFVRRPASFPVSV